MSLKKFALPQPGAAQKQPPPPIHIYLYGKHQDPTFQLLKAAAEHLATEHQGVKATVEAFFDTQYEQHLRHVVAHYGGNFAQAKASAPLAFVEADDKILYFATDKLLLEWLLVHYKYEDNTSFLLYKRMGVKALQAAKEQSGRSCCGLTIQVGDEAKETVQLQLFDEAAPELARNFLKLLSNPKFDGHPVHRVKAGCWIQAGDLVDGSGRNSEGDGGALRHECFTVPHDRPGLLGMCCHGKDTIGSQFYITLRELPFLDGKFCVIGRVISGMRTIIRIGKMAAKNERPEQEVKIFADPSLTVGAKA
eukprot:symbB.v1.2.007221.t1/scaffold441.1/size205278/8